MTLLIVVAAHYLNGGIRIATLGEQRTSGGVKAHISVLLAVVALLLFYGGSLGSILLTGMGAALGGRVGAFCGAGAATLSWLGCIWFITVLEPNIPLSVQSVHTAFVLVTLLATLWIVLTRPESDAPSVESDTVTRLLDRRQRPAERHGTTPPGRSPTESP